MKAYRGVTGTARTAKMCFLSAAHDNLMELHERGITEDRIDQARELIRQVLAEALVDGAIHELGISPS